MNEGPKVFISRLSIYLSNNIRIFNPSLKDFKVFKGENQKDKFVIFRLDGVTYYRFNNISLSNYLKILGYNKYITSLIFYIFPKKDYYLFNYLINLYINRISSIYLKSGKFIVFQSFLSLKMHKFLFNKLDWNKINYKIILNGIDVNFSNNLPISLKGEPKVLISASKFRLNKRLFEAINLINNLRSFYPNIHLHVLGELDILVNEQIKNLDVSNVTFHGLISTEILSSFYLGCDIQLSLSIFDPCPNVVLEGLACGLPVITPKQSGAFELVGLANIEWVVDEEIEFDFFNLHNEHDFITFNYDKYSIVFHNVYENLSQFKLNARKRSEELDIKHTAFQYNSIFD